MHIQTSISSIDTRFTYFQAPIKVEDALGRVFPLPSEYTYNDLNALIRTRFQEGPGRHEVITGAYEFSDSKNSKRLITSDNSYSLSPGMSITMAIIIKKPFGEDEKCPMPDCTSESYTDVPGGGRQW